MKKKTTLILLSTLHICVFCIGILVIFRSTGTEHTDTAVLTDTDIQLAGNEPDTETLPETLIALPAASETQTEPELELEIEIEPELETELETETAAPSGPESEQPSYTFQFTGRRKNLNIRTGPSTSHKIIGKIPPLKSGRVLELANGDWALIEYNGITGYSSLHWMELTPAGEN